MSLTGGLSLLHPENRSEMKLFQVKKEVLLFVLLFSGCKSAHCDLKRELIYHHKCHQQSLMLCPCTGPKVFWAAPNILCQTKNWTAVGSTQNFFVPALKLNSLLMQIISGLAKKGFGRAQYLNKFWSGTKIWTRTN